MASSGSADGSLSQQNAPTVDSGGAFLVRARHNCGIGATVVAKVA